MNVLNIVCLIFCFVATTVGSLSMVADEELSIVDQDNGDGWTRIRKPTGEEGFVPTTYIKIHWGERELSYLWIQSLSCATIVEHFTYDVRATATTLNAQVFSCDSLIFVRTFGKAGVGWLFVDVYSRLWTCLLKEYWQRTWLCGASQPHSLDLFPQSYSMPLYYLYYYSVSNCVFDHFF